MGYVYVKKSKYGIALAGISLLLISLAVYWNLSQNSRDLKALQRIPLEQIILSDQSLQVAYGNRYLYQAKLQNQSASSQLSSVNLQLSLVNEQTTNAGLAKADEKLMKWLKIWLAPDKSQRINVYFSSKYKAIKLADEHWKVNVIATKAR